MANQEKTSSAIALTPNPEMMIICPIISGVEAFSLDATLFPIQQ
ncbi:hypothetical protein [Nostoc sp. FACHB-888]|nr:hypothetical protein [Nostoc sp. FACHB-888]